jgi:uncharacterized protein YecE (DUF72 family)
MSQAPDGNARHKGYIRIGTSGWHYKHWMGLFYPEKFPPSKMLAYYARHFGTVEINNTFYRLPTEDAVVSWRDTVPDGFEFAVKASRFITHMKKLRDPDNAISLFFERAGLLGNKLGPILFQLPPHWPVNEERLEQFLSVIPGNHRYVVEFREPSWCIPRVYDILRRHNVALCLHDWGGKPWPGDFTADFTYLRFHGPTGKYAGNYDGNMLREWARRIEQWRNQLQVVYAYFNNDQGGYAIENARSLEKLLQAGSASEAA